MEVWKAQTKKNVCARRSTSSFGRQAIALLLHSPIVRKTRPVVLVIGRSVPILFGVLCFGAIMIVVCVVL